LATGREAALALPAGRKLRYLSLEERLLNASA
jgi:hypothetical protein